MKKGGNAPPILSQEGWVLRQKIDKRWRALSEAPTVSARFTKSGITCLEERGKGMAVQELEEGLAKSTEGGLVFPSKI